MGRATADWHPVSGFLDNFSRQAREYARFRPTYPDALFNWVAEQSPATDALWDCATGNGQAALSHAERFDRVFATDASATQIEHATPHPRIEYSVAPAEESGLEPGSVDAVTVATAIHWFDLSAFVEEVRRVLRPGGLFAFWTYADAELDPALRDLVREFSRGPLGPYWSDRVRSLWSAGYGAYAIPMEEIDAPIFEVEAAWNPDQLLGYLRTWSATQAFVEAQGEDPVSRIDAHVRATYGSRDTVDIRWPLQLRAFRAD